MVSQCLQNNRTDPLTWNCRWIRERADLWWYVWGSVRSGTVDQKHNTTCFTRSFRVLMSHLIVMRSEKHSHLTCCSWLSSKEDTFTSILDDTYENWYTPIKNTKTHREHRCFWFLSLYVELHFHTLWMLYPHILIQLLTVLILLNPHIHFSSFKFCSLDYSQLVRM